MQELVQAMRQARIIIRSKLAPDFYSAISSPKNIDHRMVAKALRDLEMSPSTTMTVSSVSPVGEAEDAKDWAVIDIKEVGQKGYTFPSAEWEKRIEILSGMIAKELISEEEDVVIDIEIGHRNIRLFG